MTLDDQDVRSPFDGKYRIDGLALQCGSELAIEINGTWLVGHVEHNPTGYYWICSFRGGAGTPLRIGFPLAELALKGVQVR
jgi:hypothetical protein